MQSQTGRPGAARYLTSLLAPAAVAEVMQLTWPFFEHAPVSLFLLAVVFCAWYGGLGPGLLSVVVSVVLADYFFIKPYFGISLPEQDDVVYLVSLAATGPLVSVLSEQMHRARRRTEESLAAVQLSEERYRSLVNATSKVVWSADAEGQVVAEVADWGRMTGQSFEEMKGTGWMAAAHAGDRDDLRKIWSAAKRMRTPYETEVRIRQRDGNHRHYLLRGVPVFEADGETMREWITTASDITERRRAEESLRASEERLQTVTENLTEGLVIADTDGHLLHWNRAGLEMHDFSSLEEGLRLLPEFINIFELSTLAGKVLKFDEWPLRRIYRGEHLRDFDVRIRRVKGGWERVFSYSGDIVSDPSGNRLAFLSITDITERMRAEEGLREYARILDLAPVLIRDLGDRIILWNSGAQQLYGWSSEEATGTITHDLFHTEHPRPLEEIKARLFEHGHWEGELIHTRRDGGRVVVASTWVLHRNENGEPRAILEVNNDITERKRAEEEVRRLNEELEERVRERTAQLTAANKELEAFSYSVSHDLRAPLRHINGFSQALLEDYADRLDAEGRGYLEEVRGASREMAQLIDDVLRLARVTRSEMCREAVDLSGLAQSVVADLQKQDAERPVRIDIGEGLTTRGDRRLLRIVLDNLLGNAWKFTSKQERPELAFGGEERGGETVFFVRDNGAGFDMAYADKLFGAFQRLHAAGEFEGTGIGLATVQRIINRHGGRVWAEGEVGRGATFYFTLPDF